MFGLYLFVYRGQFSIIASVSYDKPAYHVDCSHPSASQTSTFLKFPIKSEPKKCHFIYCSTILFAVFLLTAKSVYKKVICSFLILSSSQSFSDCCMMGIIIIIAFSVSLFLYLVAFFYMNWLQFEVLAAETVKSANKGQQNRSFPFSD